MLTIHSSALKHGISERRIREANAAVVDEARTDNGGAVPSWLRADQDNEARLIELVVIEPAIPAMDRRLQRT